MKTATITIDTEGLKKSVDLRELASRYTELRRESARELAGPCPKCGGNDRFHVAADFFFCRQCHPKRGDVFELLQWRHGVSFKKAASMLGGGIDAAPAEKRQVGRKERHGAMPAWDEAKQLAKLKKDQTALVLATDGQEYLFSRGLTSETWRAFGLGYCPRMSLPNTWVADKGEFSYPQQPAITMPWYHDGRLVAVRYRFLKLHTYKDAEGKERLGQNDKGVKVKGYGPTSGHVFGMQVIPPFCNQPDCSGFHNYTLRTLIICEGEINAMSIWQVAHITSLDVLSFGGQDQKLAPWVINHAERYGTVICWADRTEVAKRLQQAIRGSFAVSSEMCGGQDANDLLKTGQLGRYLSAWRYKIAVTTNSVERFVRCMAGGEDLDAGARQVLDTVMAEFGRGGA